MFHVVLFSCCLVLNVYVKAAPVGSDTCKDDMFHVGDTSFSCAILTDLNYPQQQLYGFFDKNQFYCGQQTHFEQCCESCTQVMNSVTNRTTASTPQTTEQNPPKGEEEIDVKYRPGQGEDTGYDVSIREQGPEIAEDFKLLINKDTKEEILLRFPVHLGEQKDKSLRIGLY